MRFAWRFVPFFIAGTLIPLSTLFPATASAAKPKTVELVLMLQERTPVATLAQNVLNPSSIHYEEAYSLNELREICAPLDADYNALLTQLKSKGMAILRESPTHLYLVVKGPTSIVENLFSTTISDAGNGRHRSEREGKIPQSMKVIASVSGLDTTRKMAPMSRFKKSSFHALDDDPYSGMVPAEMRKLYGFDGIVKAGLTGKGQHIAIAGYDSYDPTDVAFYRGFMIDHPGAEPDEVFFNGTPGPDPDSAAENDLDSELAGMVAPQAQIHYFLSEHNDDPGEVELFTAILDDDRAKVANYSWGDCETNVSAAHRADMDKVFARAVAQGVTVIAAAGDSGSNGCENSNKPTADWPGAHEHVMSIGGTSIWEDDFSHKISETVWDGTGGGFSAIYHAPDWQVKVTNNAMRGFPDVSFDADPNTGASVYLSYPAIPKWIQVGGTSIGAPHWSGIVALLNEARGPKGPIGFLPPYIYSLTPEQRATAFRDIVKGKNGAYSAAAGWDATTGFGSPLASSLLNFLAAM
jgi:kumamolisin